MAGTLLIKPGFLGDFVRITVLFPYLIKPVTICTKKIYFDIFKYDKEIKLLDFENFNSKEEYDLVLNLSETKEACEIVKNTKTKKLIGAYFNNNQIHFTKETEFWFKYQFSDESFLTNESLNFRKEKNIKSYPEILINILGIKYEKQRYNLNYPKENEEYLVGIEENVGQMRPIKGWKNYQELYKKLKDSNFKVKLFNKEDSLEKYIKEISKCKIIICSDTAALHLGIALNKKVIGIFGPTPENEIEKYDNVKIIKANNCKNFLKYECNEKECCLNNISVDMVFNEVKKLIKKF